MGRAKPLTIAGVEYPRQMDADKAVKAALNSHSTDVPFFDSFLAAVINEHHDEVRRAGQRATGNFMYLTPRGMAMFDPDRVAELRGGKVVMALFTPCDRWEDVTVYPWRKGNTRSKIASDLREKIARHLPHPSARDTCSCATCSADWRTLEYDHVTPTFAEMVDEVIKLMTEEEVESRFGYSKFTPGKQTASRLIPDDHPAFVRLLRLHDTNEWRWVCPLHHRNVGAARVAA